MRAFGQFARASLRHPLLVLGAGACAVLWVIATLSQSASAADPPPDVIVLSSRVFDIPFQLDATSKATRVRLYVSADQGKSWTMVAEQSIPVKHFHFEATADGDFWFAHATDLDTITDLPAQLQPERKIRVETARNDLAGPAIELDASSDLDGKLSGNLKVADANQVTALRVLYATDVIRQWKTVANDTIDVDGNFSIRPDEDWRQMSVHVTAIDSIGNASVHSKLFRRPRMAAAETPRMASTANPYFTPAAANEPPPSAGATTNRLRVQTAAGPSDPPSFLLGPGNYPTATEAPKTSAAQNYPLQSPGSGPLQTPLPGGLRDIGAVPNIAVPKIPVPKIESRGLNTFGSAFDQPSPAMSPATTARRLPAQSVNTTPMTLPAAGLTAKVTPQGIEVLPAPAAEVDRGNPTEPSNEMLLPPPKSAAAPTIESVPTPAFGPAPAENPVTENLPNHTNNPSRSIEEALRPMQPAPTSSNTIDSDSAAAVEAIPTPAPSGTVDDERQIRVERAEQISREQQQRYDRVQMARNVPFRWSNSNRFSLEYELEAVGASGTESVELYGSIDAGKTWKRWGADPDRSSPFDIETKGEGVFGFRIVVLGNNGLSSPRPLPGDTPDIAVIVDQTNPKIKITSARYGEGDRTGSLVIRYECSDENLMNRPVAIAFSDSIDGPWTTIAAGLRNEGLYVWPADPKLPSAIYLRVDATDQAGNTGSYLLDQPIATGGLAPRARILGFQSR